MNNKEKKLLSWDFHVGLQFCIAIQSFMFISAENSTNHIIERNTTVYIQKTEFYAYA